MDPSTFRYEVYFECPGLEDEDKRKKVKNYFNVRRKSGGGDCGPLKVSKGNVYRLAFKEEKDQLCVLERRDHKINGFPIIVVHGNPQSLGHKLSTITTAPPEADNPEARLPSPPETELPIAASPSPPIGKKHEVHQEGEEGKPLEEGFRSKGSLADKGRVMVSSSEQGHPDGFKGHRTSQSTNKVDIVGHMQGKLEETGLPLAKLDESETESLHKFKKSTTDIYSSAVRSHQLGSNFPSSHKYGDSIPLSEQGGKTDQCYVLPGGGRVLVRHGDITKEKADALVNAANGYLRHNGGVAAALSRAGGFSVQQESTALVTEHGPFATGESVMTTGGYMQCKKLIHIVGPVQGEANGQERQLLTRSVLSALKLADDNEFRSIALPCISSGIFNVPISVCAEAIVTAVERFCTHSLHLNTITLIDTREEVVRALQVACDRILLSDNAERGAAGDGEFQESTGASAPPPSPNYGAIPVNLEEQEGATVSPMKDDDPRSTGWDHAIHSSTIQSNQPPPEYNLISTGRKAETQIGHLSDQPVTQHMDALHFTRDHMRPSPRNVQGGKTDQCYVLPEGGRVLVRHGDITKEQADALVNAANRHLRHDGGVAAALSHVGGFSVQQESTALVTKHGPFATGESVMTTGGNLQCKKLIHIVGPVHGEANGQERQLLTRSVLSALTLADNNQFRSIALPCISSCVLQVPISVCAEAIVTAVESFGRRSLHLKTITLIDTREEVVRALQVACDRVFPSANAELGAAGGGEFQESTGASAPRPLSNDGANPVNRGPDISDIQNVVGYIEKQNVDVIVSPMKNSDPRSTGVGEKLSKIIGPKTLNAAFSRVKKDHHELVEVNVTDLEELSCRKVFFVNLIPWKEKDTEAAVQVLRRGLLQVLSSCQNQGFDSVAFPMLGTGKVFKFPQDEAASVLLEVIEIHKRSQHNSRPLKIRIVLHPGDQPPSQASPPWRNQSMVAHSNTASSDTYSPSSPSSSYTGHQHPPASPDERELHDNYCSLM